MNGAIYDAVLSWPGENWLYCVNAVELFLWPLLLSFLYMLDGASGMVERRPVLDFSDRVNA